MTLFLIWVFLALCLAICQADDPRAGGTADMLGTGTWFGHELSLINDQIVGTNPFHFEIVSPTMPSGTANSTAWLLADMVCGQHGMRLGPDAQTCTDASAR